MIICKWPDAPDDQLQEAGSPEQSFATTTTTTTTTTISTSTSTGVTGGMGATGVTVNVICEAVELIIRVQ